MNIGIYIYIFVKKKFKLFLYNFEKLVEKD